MTEWRTVGYVKTSTEGPLSQHQWAYHLTLPEPLASWDVFDYWEQERTESMRHHLNHGDILIDVGAEHGWLSTVYAKFVGPQNMVLVEPTTVFWPNIKATWEHNCDRPARLCYAGLAAATTTDPRPMTPGWPGCADGELIDRNAYTYLHDNDSTPRIRLDDLAARAGILPDALTIDVEGAELEVLTGATGLLGDVRFVWVSIHPDLMLRDYGTDPEELRAFMADHGYIGEHLATDHEEHYLFRPECR